MKIHRRTPFVRTEIPRLFLAERASHRGGRQFRVGHSRICALYAWPPTTDRKPANWEMEILRCRATICLTFRTTSS